MPGIAVGAGVRVGQRPGQGVHVMAGVFVAVGSDVRVGFGVCEGQGVLVTVRVIGMKVGDGPLPEYESSCGVQVGGRNGSVGVRVALPGRGVASALPLAEAQATSTSESIRARLRVVVRWAFMGRKSSEAGHAESICLYRNANKVWRQIIVTEKGIGTLQASRGWVMGDGAIWCHRTRRERYMVADRFVLREGVGRGFVGLENKESWLLSLRACGWVMGDFELGVRGLT